MEQTGARSLFDTRVRRPIHSLDECPPGRWTSLLETWIGHGGQAGVLPDYSSFDILDMPGALWPNICLTKLCGTPRRFYVELIGSNIEAHNGFAGNKRFMSELPLKNRRVMAREFWYAAKFQTAVYSEGPYIGALDYIRKVRRLITPYRISKTEYAFVFFAEFEPYPDQWAKFKVRGMM